MNDENIQSLFPFYALGTLTDAEIAQVEQYVETRPSARAELNDLIAATAELACLADPDPGTAAEKDALMARIRRDATPGPARPQPKPAPAPRESFLETLQRLLAPLRAPALVALSLLVVALALWSLSLRTRLGNLNDQVAALESDLSNLQGDMTGLTAERDALQTAADDLAAQNASLTQQLQNQQQVLVALGRSDTVTVAIGGTEAQPDSSGFLVLNANEGLAFLSVSGLPELTAEQDYQLWLIEGDTPFSAGVFSVGQPGQSTHAFTVDAERANFNAVGVSIEPTGGSPQPTGDIVLLGARPS
jgi:anti-sigma-K factor RskA